MDFKEQFLKKLEELTALNLSKGEYAITGSGPLAIRNIRIADDIDVMVKPNLWNKLSIKYTPYDKQHIKIGNIEIWRDFINLTSIMDKVIDSATLIEGFPFVSIESTLSWKRYLNREKDQKDIILIEDYLSNHKG